MKYLLLPALLLMMYSCSTVKVTNNFDKNVDFKSYETFSLFPWDPHNEQVVNEYDRLLIEGAIKDEMAMRGLKHVEKDGDLVISTFVLLQEKTMNQAYTNHYGGAAGGGYYGGGWNYYASPWAYGYGWGGPAYTSTTISSRDYVEGTLLIDAFQLEGKKLVWQGIGSGEVNEDFSKRDKKLPAAIGHIFRKFPATGKKAIK